MNIIAQSQPRPIARRSDSGCVCYELTAPMPVGNLDRLLGELITERPKARTVLRLATATGDEFVFGRDHRGRERLEFLDHDGNRRKVMPLLLQRQAGTWTMTTAYWFREGSPGDELQSQRVQRLAETLPSLDDDPLAIPPRAPFCRICGRALTDPISAGVGIGPECGGRYPWLFDRRPSEQREALASRKPRAKPVPKYPDPIVPQPDARRLADFQTVPTEVTDLNYAGRTQTRIEQRAAVFTSPDGRGYPSVLVSFYKAGECLRVSSCFAISANVQPWAQHDRILRLVIRKPEKRKHSVYHVGADDFLYLAPDPDGTLTANLKLPASGGTLDRARTMREGQAILRATVPAFMDLTDEAIERAAATTLRVIAGGRT